MKNKYFKRVLISGSFLSIAIILSELVFRLNINFAIIKTQILVFCFALCIGFGLEFLISLLPRIASRIIESFVLLLIWGAFGIQICYHEVFKTFATLGTVLKGTQAVSNFSVIIKESIGANIFPLFIILLPFVISVVILIFQINKKKFASFLIKKEIILTAVCGVVLCRIVYLTLIFFTAGIHNGAFMLYTQKRPVVDTVKGLGVLSSFSVDAARGIFKTDDFPSAKILKKLYGKISASQTGDDVNKLNKFAKIVMPAETEMYNVLEIDFEKLKNDNADEVYHGMDNYFSSLQPDKKNNYTGIFKGKNLIYLTAESFSKYAVDKEITPTLYKLVHEGFYFTNFYNPYWEISTTDGEYVNCLGLIPKSGTYSFKDSAKNNLMFALGNEFKKQNYVTRAYHNYDGNYYERNLTHPNLGYTFCAMGNGYRKSKTWPDSDLEMMKITLPDYIDEKLFHAYYMTVSAHLPYNTWDNSIAKQNENLVKDLPYDKTIQSYFACNIELDKALEYLLEQLNKKGIAEQTVIVMAADHYPYGLKPQHFNKLAGHKVDLIFELYKSNLIIYNQGQKSEQIDKLCSSMDILPTVLNLFDLQYDSRLLTGHDIFSDSEPFVVFESNKVLTNEIKYRGDIDKAESLNGKTFTNEDVDKIKEKLYQQVHYSSLILEKNYYERIQSALSN